MSCGAVTRAAPIWVIWSVVVTRMASDPRTQRYLERRCKEGLTKAEAMRCLKRYVARETYRHLPRT